MGKQTYEIPVINDENDLKELFQTCYRLEYYLETEDLYEDFFEKMYAILKGCIETLPQALQQATREEDKKDVFLIFRYLSDCCSLGLLSFTVV